MLDNIMTKAEDEECKNEAGKMAGKGGRRAVILITTVLLFVAIIAIVGVVYAQQSPSRRFRKQMDLGAKYLSEQNYEQAIASYQLALEIDPKNVDAYLGLAEVYVATGNNDEALKVLRDGYEKTRDERLMQEIAEVEKLLNAKGEASENTNSEDEDISESQQENLGENIEEQIVTGPLLVKSTEYEDETMLGWSEFEYDEHGHKVKETAYYSDGSLNYTYEYEYNNKGKETKLKSIYRDPLYENNNEIREKEYDVNGNMIKESIYDLDGGLKSWNLYENDVNGNMIKESIYDLDGGLESWNLYEYDSKGNWVKAIHYWPIDEELNGKPYGAQYFGAEYDEKGNQVIYIWYGAGGADIWMWRESEYDEWGNHISAVDYAYDTSGNMGYDRSKAKIIWSRTYVNEYVDWP